jgi:hypothetical protein
MTRFDDLDRALTSYFDIEAVAPAPAGLLESAMDTTSRHRPRAAWHARLRAGSVSAPRGESARTLLIAAGLVALLLAIVGFALLGGSPTPRPNLGVTEASPSTLPSAEPASNAIAAGVADEALRSTWLADTGEGRVQLSINGAGSALSARGVILGGSFDSAVASGDDGLLELTLDRNTANCTAGDVGHYRAMLSSERDLLTLLSLDDECLARTTALGRSWGRSLLDGTTEGSGFVTSMPEPFRVDLPDQSLVSRTLPDMVEIAGQDEFSLLVFRNPVGFADPCSTEEVRVPYVAGADAFADFLQQNPALTTLSVEETTVAGYRTIHIVTVGKTDGAPCDSPPNGYYIWTPKDCDCHFVTGPDGKDSTYLVEVGEDTYMFIVSPPDVGGPVETGIMDSLELPARLPAD